MLTQLLKRLPQTEIIKKIKSNSANSIDLLNDIEQILIKKRKYVFKMPKPNNPVIALMSGGLDTTVVISLLLEHYKLKVFPLVIDRGIPNSYKAKQSINYFSNYFLNKYPHSFNKPFQIKYSIPPIEFKSILSKRENDPVLKTFRKGIPLQPLEYAKTALFYSNYLETTHGVYPLTIIGGWLPANSEWYSYESITALRSIMLNLCCVDNNFEWQFTSLPMEKELGFYFGKEKLVEIGTNLQLPLHRTWTCYLGLRYHCGNCPPCWTRQEGFKLAGVPDPTKYMNKKSTSLMDIIYEKINTIYKN